MKPENPRNILNNQLKGNEDKVRNYRVSGTGSQDRTLQQGEHRPGAGTCGVEQVINLLGLVQLPCKGLLHATLPYLL